MSALERGEVWLGDLGMAAKVRPCLVLSIPVLDTERALATSVAHTPTQRGTRFEIAVNVRFLRLGLFGKKEIHTMRNLITILLLALLLFCGGASAPPDGFSGVRCGSDIPKALIGRFMRTERVVAIENRHKDIGLKDLGGTEISANLFAISWKICGDEFMLLEDHSIVRDVLKFPEHSKRYPEFIGECQINGTKMSEVVVAVLDNNEEGTANLSAKIAWKIDKKRAKFIKLPTEGLRCPRDGIITEDETK